MLDAVDLRAHHHWRTDWTADRPCLYWYLTFEAADRLGDLVDALAPVFDRVPWLHRVPRDWLHLTIREVGFADEVDADELHRIAASADRALEQLPLLLDVERITTMTDAVVLAVRPTPALAAVCDALGDAASANPEPPHITIGYVGRDGHRDEVLPAFAQHFEPLTDVRSRLTLAAVDRLPTHYQWRPVVMLDP